MYYCVVGTIGEGKDAAESVVYVGCLRYCAQKARELHARWGTAMTVRMYRPDGTEVARRGRRVRLP